MASDGGSTLASCVTRMAFGPTDSTLGVRVTFAERSAVSGLSCTVTVNVVSPSGTFPVAERVIHSLAASSIAALR